MRQNAWQTAVQPLQTQNQQERVKREKGTAAKARLDELAARLEEAKGRGR